MVLATKDLWKIVDSSKLRPPSTANDNNMKAYEQWCKMAFTIIVMSFMDKKVCAKDWQKRGRHYATYTRSESYPTSCL